jgi:hypothetical protein
MRLTARGDALVGVVVILLTLLFVSWALVEGQASKADRLRDEARPSSETILRQ